MRPVRLTISGWGPYPKEEKIDFSSYGDGEIFLITGPTGSGKTTIFDAITYAIYGMVSGKNRDKNSVRSDFAREGQDTYVELVFLHKGKEYIVKRTPRYFRAKKRGEGFVTSQETAELIEEGKPPVTNVKEVNQRLLEIMGLSYEQYKQIAMLAQGEFLELLLASSRDRVAIFRDIFKTQLFEKLQKNLTEKAKDLYLGIKELDHKMEEAISTIDYEEDTQLEQELKMEYMSYTRVWNQLEQAIERDRKGAAELKVQIGKLEETLQKLTAKGTAYFQVVKQRQLIEKDLEKYGETVKAAVANLEKIKTDMEAKRMQMEQVAKALNEKLEEGEKRKVEKLKEADAFRGIEEKLSKVLVELERISHEKEGLLVLAEREKKLSEQEKLLARKQKNYEAADNMAKQAKKAYEEKEEAYRREAIGLVARLVKEGEPCPVCGSLTHPKVAQFSGKAPDEKELENWKSKWEEEEKARQVVYEDTFREKGIRDGMAEELRRLLKERSLTAEGLLEAIEGCKQQEKDKKEERLKLEAARKEKEKWEREIGRLERELIKLKKDQDMQKERQNKERLKAQEEENKRKMSLEKEKSLLSMKEKEYKAIQKEEAAYKSNLEISLLETQMKEAEDEKKQLQKRREKMVTRHKVNKNAYDSLKIKMEEREKQEEIYRVYKDLDNVTRGNNKERIVFEHYVLAAYFEDVLEAANIRFTAMTGGRYELKKVGSVADARTTDSLELEVIDNYTGKRRSVKTLSGGESFKAALSLALGLSDMIQNSIGGIQVETLFIDEGFGSLDQESLDQALSSLMKLMGNNQMVGIISHVNELKERIHKQIVIDKGNAGSRVILNN